MTLDPARRVAAEAERRGLGAPIRLLADAHRPIAPLLSDLVAATGPLLSVMVGRRADPLRAVLDEERGLEAIVHHLDEPGDRGHRAEPG